MKITSAVPDGIPSFVSVFGALVAILGILLDVRGLLDPTSAVGFIKNAEMLAGAWAGRTLGLGLITAFALWLRTSQAYTMAFLGCSIREFGDIVGAFNSGQTGLLPVLFGFFLLDVLCLFMSFRALKIVFNAQSSKPSNTSTS